MASSVAISTGCLELAVHNLVVTVEKHGSILV